MAAQKKSSELCPRMTMYYTDPRILETIKRLSKEYELSKSEVLRCLVQIADRDVYVQECLAREAHRP